MLSHPASLPAIQLFDKLGRSALSYCASRDDQIHTFYTLAYNQPMLLTMYDQTYLTPVLLMANHGCYDLVFNILNSDEPINQEIIHHIQTQRAEISGRSFLHLATIGRHHKLMELVLEKGLFDVNHQSKDPPVSALYYAMKNEDQVGSIILLRYGADPDNKPPYATRLQKPREFAKNKTMIKELLDQDDQTHDVSHMLSHIPQSLFAQLIQK
jgi:hypothetical protein